MKRITRLVMAAAAAFVLTLGISACSFGESSFSMDVNDETGAYMIEAANAEGMVSGELEIGEGDVLQLSPVLDKGKIQVQLKQGDEVAFDETVDGRILSTYDVEPGTYTVEVIAVDKPTGSMTIYAADKDEVASMEEALEEALAEAEAEAQD